MADQMKETKIYGKVIGLLEEKALELEENVSKEKDGKKYTTDIIKGKLIVDGIEINVYAQSRFADKDNSMYKGIFTIYNDYVDKLAASKDPSLTADTVDVSIKYECNDYATPTAAPTEIKSGIRISLFKANRVSPETEHKAELDINGAVVRSIKPEMKDEDETGRLIVEIATFDYTGKLKPFTLIVEDGSEEDGLDGLVDGFKDMFEAGQTVRLYAQLVAKQVGGDANKGKKAAFGKKAQVSSGFTVIETQIIGGEEPFDEENSYALADVKAAMNQRDEELDAMLKKAKEDANKPKGGKNSGLGGNAKAGGGKATGGKGALGKKPSPMDETDSDLPF